METKYKKIFFVGIGGAGMSALARMMKARGVNISGSDVSENDETKKLISEGVDVKIGQDISLIPSDVDVAVYSNALKKYAPEFLESLRKKFKVYSYPEMLGEVSREMETIAISGTHGKTTTTAMVSTVLCDSGICPTVTIGGTLVREGTNFLSGDGKYLIVEADEYERAFHNYFPKILIITNIDLDHLDYYKDLADIQGAFKEMVDRIPEDGAIICNLNDERVSQILAEAKAKIIDYTKVSLDGVKLKFPGEHMRSNSKAVLALTEFLQLPREKVVESLVQFNGTERRFEYKGETENGALVFDDYAHNPGKVRAAVAGAREMFPDRKIVAVFQPHLYSRTKKLFNEIAGSFADADEVVLLPIFPAREKFDPSISSEMLMSEMKNIGVNVHYCESIKGAQNFLKSASENEVIVAIGAGDINKLAVDIVKTKNGLSL